MSKSNNLQFKDFLLTVAQTSYQQNTTATGTVTIQQTQRNELRKQGLQALKADLETIYGEWFDIVETKEGIVIVVENEADDFTFSWEIKSTIKALDYDPFMEGDRWEDEKEAKAQKRAKAAADKAAKVAIIEAKRAAKLKEKLGA